MFGLGVDEIPAVSYEAAPADVIIMDIFDVIIAVAAVISVVVVVCFCLSLILHCFRRLSTNAQTHRLPSKYIGLRSSLFYYCSP